jgi:hypothetical protein
MAAAFVRSQCATAARDHLPRIAAPCMSHADWCDETAALSAYVRHADACVLVCACLLHVFTVKGTVAHMNATWALLQHAELRCASYMLSIG